MLDTLEDIGIIVLVIAYPVRLVSLVNALRWITLAKLVTFWSVVISSRPD